MVGLWIVAIALGAGVASSIEPAAAPLWFDGDRPSAQAQQAVALLQDAGADGLEPAHYDADRLQRAVVSAAEGSLPDAETRVRVDAELTRAMQRFLTDLNRGRIDPRRIHADYHLPRRSFDAAATLRAAVADQRLPEAVRQAAPRLQLYADLRRVLADYRALGNEAWRVPLPALPGGKVEPAQDYSGLPVVAQRLQALGDLPNVGQPPLRYDGAMVEAVRAFQRRHGLTDDGVIGRATRAALDVSPSQRVEQIALTMERLRWTPLLQGPRMIVVNVPEFVLRGYEVRGDRIDVRLRMKVIIGRALQTRTPLINEDMRFIEFSPYWNVPASIARDELVPRLRNEPAYFEHEGFEFVGPSGDVSTALSADLLEAVRRGEWRLRQRPGPRNALGDIKFVFPNNESIYLHHTPAPRLFERDRRDFSHGCIRVEDPVSLALFALRDQPDWTEARIREAMTQGSARVLRLATPLPVLVAYATALVKDGRPYFFPDLYGHDQVLARALQDRPAIRPIARSAQ